MKKTTKSIIIAVVAVVVLVGALFAIIKFMPENNKGDETSVTYPTDENGEQYATDAKGNVIPSVKDKDGNIISAGEVVLTEKGPLKLQEIDVTNKFGKYTIKSTMVDLPKEKATDPDGNPTGQTKTNEYTIVGYEDAGINAGGQTEAIANSISNLKTLDIIDIKGKNLEDYGLDKPQVVVTGKYSDKTENTMKIGNDAAGSKQVYMQFGKDKAVYLVDKKSVESFYYSPLELVSLEVYPSVKKEGELTEPIKVTLTGKNYPKKVEIESNDDVTTEAYFKSITPDERPINVTIASEIMGSIKGLNANKVLAVNPTKDQLKKYNLDTPYAHIVADFKTEVLTMSAGKPIEAGFIPVYSEDKDIIYSIDPTLARWATTSYEELKYEYIAKPIITYVEAVKVTANGKTHTYNLDSKTAKDEEGNETTQLVVKSNDKKLNTEYFETFYQNLSAVKREDSSDKYEKQGNSVLTVEYIYNNDKKSDVIEYFDAGSRKYIAQVNGKSDGIVYETYIKQIGDDVKALSKNERVDPI